MILPDTSVWIAHLRSKDDDLAGLLENGQVLAHPFVIGELALGNLRQRDVVLDALQGLPQASVATDGEILHFIGQNSLSGLDIGYIDVHLLASARVTADVWLWTRDRRLREAAIRLGLAANRP